VAPLLPKLRGHFAEFLNHSSPDRLGILYLTTCVGLGYGPRGNSLEAFLGSMGSLYFASFGYASRLSLRVTRICLCHGLHAYTRHQLLAELPSCVTPSFGYYRIRSRAPLTRPEGPTRFGRLVSPSSPGTRPHGYGNINPLSIDYACRPRLRSRLTLGGLAWPRNPWSSGGRVSHSSFATHACILTRTASTTGSLRRFHGCTTLPYPSTPLHPHPKVWVDVLCE
jgi:hypothetical protein